jgi:hypothetical protein
MAGTMTNAEITAEFEELFGNSAESDNEDEPDTEETESTDEEETSEDTTEETEDDEESTDESEEEEEDGSKDESESQRETKPSSQAKQNRAFAEQRLQIKENEKFIRSIGKLIGFDEKASLKDIQAKVKEVLIEKEAKDQGISVELAKRLDELESDKREVERIKLESKIQEDFTSLIEKYKLDENSVAAFTAHLRDSGKNPFEDKTVDIEAEYLKLHHDDLVQAAIKEALAKETNRKKKVEEKAATGAPGGASEKEEGKISSIADLDKYFDSLDI